MLNGLDLFSGIGGISIALSEWVRPIAYCEIDPYCQGILLSRISEGSLPKPGCGIWDDIKTFDGSLFQSSIDILYGGFPCQGISIAGLGKGLADGRSGLFWEIVRLAQEIKPKFIFLENVPAITSRGGVAVVRAIAEMGYDCRWCVLSANKFVDQKRERWFLLAKSRCMRQQKGSGERIQQKRESSVNEEFSNYKLQDMEQWAAYSRSMRKDNGIPNRVDRIRALGNAVVPSQAKEAFKILMGLNGR